MKKKVIVLWRLSTLRSLQKLYSVALDELYVEEMVNVFIEVNLCSISMQKQKINFNRTNCDCWLMLSRDCFFKRSNRQLQYSIKKLEYCVEYVYCRLLLAQDAVTWMQLFNQSDLAGYSCLPLMYCAKWIKWTWSFGKILESVLNKLL